MFVTSLLLLLGGVEEAPNCRTEGRNQDPTLKLPPRNLSLGSGANFLDAVFLLKCVWLIFSFSLLMLFFANEEKTNLLNRLK